MLSSAIRRSTQPATLSTLLAPKRTPAFNVGKNRVLENQRKFQAQADIPVYLRGRGKIYHRIAQAALAVTTGISTWQIYTLVVGTEA